MIALNTIPECLTVLQVASRYVSSARVEFVDTGEVAWIVRVQRVYEMKWILLHVADLDMLRQNPSLYVSKGDAAFEELRDVMDVGDKVGWLVYVLEGPRKDGVRFLSPVKGMRFLGCVMVIDAGN